MPLCQERERERERERKKMVLTISLTYTKIPSFSSFGLGYISDKLIFDSYVLFGHKADGPAQKQVVGFWQN